MYFGSTVRPCLIMCDGAGVLRGSVFMHGINSFGLQQKERFVCILDLFGMDLTQNARCVSILSHCDFDTNIITTSCD